MPSDQARLNEDSVALGAVIQILLFLITPIFNDTSCCFFLDKAFTSFKLIRLLAKRGIHVVGMMRASRPKKAKGGKWEDYWPFRTYTKPEERGYARGCVRSACTALPGTEWMVQAVLWLDNRWVTMAATTFLFVSYSVKRWDRSLRKRVTRGCLYSLYMYNKHMGSVDALGRSNATANIRMPRCQKRFQRQLFFWLVSTTCHHNVRIIFCALWPDIETKKKRHRSVGFNTWFQYTLGSELMTYCVAKAKDALGSQEQRQRLGLRPVFMPKKVGRPVLHPESHISAVPEDHEYVPVAEIFRGRDKKSHRGLDPLKRNRCKGCSAKALKSRGGKGIRGGMSTTHGGTRNATGAVPKPVPMSSFGCSKCKVNLCAACFKDPASWDHERRNAPALSVCVG